MTRTMRPSLYHHYSLLKENSSLHNDFSVSLKSRYSDIYSTTNYELYEGLRYLGQKPASYLSNNRVKSV